MNHVDALRLADVIMERLGAPEPYETPNSIVTTAVVHRQGNEFACVPGAAIAGVVALFADGPPMLTRDVIADAIQLGRSA